MTYQKVRFPSYIVYKIAFLKDINGFKERGETVPVLPFGDYPFAILHSWREVTIFLEASEWKGYALRGYYRVQRVGKNYYEVSPSTYVEKRMGKTRYLFKEEISDLRRGRFNCESDMFEPPCNKLIR